MWWVGGGVVGDTKSIMGDVEVANAYDFYTVRFLLSIIASSLSTIY